MAKSKSDLLEEAKALELDVTVKNTVAEITEAIKNLSKEDAPKEETEEPKLAKAGKRSAKAIAEAEAKEAKEARKASEAEEETESKPKQPVKPTRSKLERRGKKYKKAAEAVDKTKLYTVAEATELVGKTSPVNFDATVELHVNLNVDPRHADQNIRDNLVLPAGTGKTVRVAVFADETVEGADVQGIEDITKLLEKGTFNFDILIATPATMAKLGKYARVLGPRGLMPNPKSGTVTNDVTKAVQQAKAGRVEYRVDSTGIVHVGVGKISFTAVQLKDNVQAVLASIKGNKPASVKSNYISSIHLASTMGPSIAIAVNEA